MAQGSSPPPAAEIRSPEERRAAAEDAAAEAEVEGEGEAEEEEVFDDAFDIPHKNAPHDRLRRWRQAALVLNASRRFRYTLDLKKEEEKEIIRRKIRSHAQVIRAAFLFKEAGQKDTSEAYTGINVATASRSFPIELEKLNTLNRDHDNVVLQEIGGVRGLSDLLKSNLEKGISPNDDELLQRRNVYGSNTYPRQKRKNILPPAAATRARRRRRLAAGHGQPATSSRLLLSPLSPTLFNTSGPSMWRSIYTSSGIVSPSAMFGYFTS